MNTEMEKYLEKRVKFLLSEKWERSRIVQQLEALSTKKKIEQLIDIFGREGSMTPEYKAYLERRIKELKEQGWSDSEIAEAVQFAEKAINGPAEAKREGV